MNMSLNLRFAADPSTFSNATTPDTLAAFPALITRSPTSRSTTSKATESSRTPLSSDTMKTTYFPGSTFSNRNSPSAFVVLLPTMLEPPDSPRLWYTPYLTTNGFPVSASSTRPLTLKPVTARPTTISTFFVSLPSVTSSSAAFSNSVTEG